MRERMPDPKPKRPLPKAGTNGARVLAAIRSLVDLAIGPTTTVLIAREAGFDRATTRAALAHLAAAGHIESVPKPGSDREKLWRLT
jgi:DNA-binding MarR family transcriptional regulator